MTNYNKNSTSAKHRHPGQNSRFGMFFLLFILIILFVFFSSVFRVNQGFESILLKLGKMKTDSSNKVIEYQPGIHFKMPFIDSIYTYDMRLRTLTIDSSRIVTNEQKDVLVDAYVEWRISDISKFYRAASGNERRAATLLKQYVESALRAEVGKRAIETLITNERDLLTDKLVSIVQAQAKEIGLSVLDVRIKQIDLPDSVTDSIYQRMRSDREKDASKIRADGKQTAEEIRANADAQASIIIATAKSNAKKLVADGQATAAALNVKNYSKNPKLQDFLLAMNAYQTTFDHGGKVLVLQPNGPFFKQFHASKISASAPTSTSV